MDHYLTGSTALKCYSCGTTENLFKCDSATDKGTEKECASEEICFSNTYSK